MHGRRLAPRLVLLSLAVAVLAAAGRAPSAAAGVGGHAAHVARASAVSLPADAMRSALYLPLVGHFTAGDLASWRPLEWRYFGSTDVTYDVAVDPRTGMAWVATESGLVRVDPSTGDMRRTTFQSLTLVAVDTAGRVWIGGGPRGEWDGVSYLDVDGVWHRLGSADGLAAGSLRDIVADSFGNVWLAYGTTNWSGTPSRPLNGGVSRVAPDGTVAAFGVREGLPGQGATSLVPDRAGGVWVTLGDVHFDLADEFHGIAHLPAARPPEIFTEADGLPSRWATVTATDIDGAPIIVVNWMPHDVPEAAIGAHRLERDGRWRKLALPPEQSVLDELGLEFVAVAPDGARWFGDGWRLLRVNPDGTWRALPGYDGSTWDVEGITGAAEAKGMAFGPDGSAWLGRDTHAPLAQLRPDDRWVVYGGAGSAAAARVREIEVDAAGGVWFGPERRIAPDGGAVYTHGAGRSYSETPLVVDGSGAVWVSIGPGLVRIAPDGRRDVFDARTGLLPRGGGVQALAIAPDRTVWAGTTDGIAHWRAEGRWATSTVTAGLATDNVRAIAFDATGATWAACVEQKGWDPDRQALVVVHEAGLSRRASDGTWATYRFEGLIASSLAVAGDGSVWTDAVYGLLRLAPDGTWAVVGAPPHGPVPLRVGALAFDRNGNLWVGTAGEPQGAPDARAGSGVLILAADGAWTGYDAAQGLPFRWVRDILPAPDGAVWLAGGGDDDFATPGRGPHVARLDPAGSITPFPLVRPWPLTSFGAEISDSGVTTGLAFDSRGNLLAAGADRLVHRLAPDGGFTTLSPLPSLDASTAGEVRADSAGGVWVATWRGAAHWTADGEWRTYHTDDGLPTPLVETVAPDASGGVWLGFAADWDGAAQAWRATGASYRAADGAWRHLVLPADCPGQGVHAVAVDSSGGLWLATHRPAEQHGRYGRLGTGVSYLSPDGAWRHHGTADGLPSDQVSALIVDAAGTVWVATDHGIARRAERGGWQAVTTADGFDADQVLSLSLDPRGWLWAGTTSGASRFDGRAWATLTEGDGLPDDQVNDIAFDAFGTAWFATEAGGVAALTNPR